MKYVGGALGLVLLLALSATAMAQEDERARLHFESGRSYFEEGAYEDALREFDQAYELSHRSVLLWNIGTTQERLGMYGEAAGSFERYLAEVADAPNREVLERRIRNLRERARTGETAPPTEAHPEPPSQSQGTSPSPPASSGGGGGDGLLLGGIVALSVGGLGLASFAIFGGLALGEQSSVETGCFATRSCTPDDVSTMDTFAVVADVSLVIGLAAAAAGGVLIVLGATSSSSEQASLRVAPMAGPGLAGVSLGGGF